MRLRFANRASALIVQTVAVDAAEIELEAGAGARFPALASGEMFRATLIAPDGTSEIVSVTAMSADTATVERAQEGTPAGTFPSGARFELRVTAGVLAAFLQRFGDTMDGPLDMNGHPIKRPLFDAPSVFQQGVHTGIIRAPDVPVNAAYTTAENAIVIPPNGTQTVDARRPQYMGSPILNSRCFAGIVMDWYGDVNNVPSWFKLCDGSNNTPDMRGVFVKGWTATFGVGGRAGAESAVTSAAPPHAHGGATAPHALTIEQIPPHRHAGAFGGAGGTEGAGPLGGSLKDTSVVGGGQAHLHGIYNDGGHTHVVATQPPFIVLARVMFNI